MQAAHEALDDRPGGGGRQPPAHLLEGPIVKPVFRRFNTIDLDAWRCGLPRSITARLGSSRLPRKMLADLGGRTVLERLVERLRAARSGRS